MSRWRELHELTRVRVLLFLREPEAIFWVFAFPLVLAAILGYAFRDAGVEASPIGVLEGPDGAALVELLERDEDLTLELFAEPAPALRQLHKGAIDAFLEPGEPPRLSFDPQRREAAVARLRVLRALEVEALGETRVVTEVQIDETGSRYVDFLFPGLLGMNLMGTGMWGIGFAIADFRRRKFLKRLMVTPMRRSSFFLSFILSRLFFLALEVLVLVGFGVWVLDVPLRGSLLAFGLLTVLGAFAFSGLGLLVASRVRTIEGVSGLMNLVMMPMWLGSGVFFSYERFPDAIHPVLRLLPLTALNDALRALMLDGAGLGAAGVELLVLFGWAAATFLVALRIFRWE